MARVFFESPPDPDPIAKADSTFRRSGISTIKIVVFAVFALALTGGGAWLQRRVVPGESQATFASAREDSLLRRRRILMWFRDPDEINDVQLAQKSFADPAIAEFAKARFVTFEVTPKTENVGRLRADYSVTEFPTLIVTTANGIVLKDANGEPLRRSGYLDVAELDVFLRHAAGTTSSGRRIRPRQ